MSVPSFFSQRLVSLYELRSSYSAFCEYLAFFPVEAVNDDPTERERIKQRFSKFGFRHIQEYASDVADESQRRLRIFEVPSPESIDDDDYLILSKTKPARLRLANLPDEVFRSIVADIHAELLRRYFGEDSPFELHLRRQLDARTSELYFAAGEEACKVFEKVFVDEFKYRQLLGYRDERAQTLLDLMSMLVDHPTLGSDAKSCMIKTLMRLSQNSFLYPQSLLVGGIKRDDIPFSSGKFGDVYRGTFRGQTIGLKVIKIYKKSDLSRVFKVMAIVMNLGTRLYPGDTTVRLSE
ncbi:hypothetical protein P691DRAFT_775282 [Macrolepiota fuliginosa MF-IS2]|uniref:Uncharacterized protein n=1 Tax=Macrolepiota fuliginosa MF-IS2 TaxID=1400762 RepID=A0A9P5XG24_9AGAR|nr:hypothetical protein P691DRAFT_775282 [Macrolepiota fuliginosa MF-IS2]